MFSGIERSIIVHWNQPLILTMLIRYLNYRGTKKTIVALLKYIFLCVCWFLALYGRRLDWLVVVVVAHGKRTVPFVFLSIICYLSPTLVFCSGHHQSVVSRVCHPQSLSPGSRFWFVATGFRTPIPALQLSPEYAYSTCALSRFPWRKTNHDTLL